MKNFLTYGKLDYTGMKAAGNLTENDINKNVRQSYINNRMMKIYALLDGLNDPFYNRVTTITTSADMEQLEDSAHSGIITAINATTKVISRNTGAFSAGDILFIAYAIYTGGSSIAIDQAWIARVTTGGANAVYTVLHGSDVTLSATYAASVQVLKSLSVSSSDLSGVYFKNIVRISDNKYTSTPGAKIRVFDAVTDPNVFYNLDKDPFQADRVAWYLRGDTVDLFVGVSAISLGTVTAEYRGKPGVFTDATVDDVIDLPPEYNQVLIDEVVTAYVIDRGKAVPEDVATRLKTFYDASEAQLKKAKEKKNQ